MGSITIEDEVIDRSSGPFSREIKTFRDFTKNAKFRKNKIKKAFINLDVELISQLISASKQEERGMNDLVRQGHLLTEGDVAAYLRDDRNMIATKERARRHREYEDKRLRRFAKLTPEQQKREPFVEQLEKTLVRKSIQDIANQRLMMSEARRLRSFLEAEMRKDD